MPFDGAQGTFYAHHSEVPWYLWRWPNFAPDEPNLACPCCAEFYLDEGAMDQLQAARTNLGRPMRINSGHRCAIHNARVGGAPLSRHKLIAFDIDLAGHDRGHVLEVLRDAGFSTFGFYRTFIHTDTRLDRRWYGKGARKLWDF